MCIRDRFWASKDDALEDAFSSLWGADDNKIDDPDRNTNAVKALYRAVEEHGRNPILSDETRFYILGLAPNAARISIRFWYVGTVLQDVYKRQARYLPQPFLRSIGKPGIVDANADLFPRQLVFWGVLPQQRRVAPVFTRPHFDG